LQQNRIPVQDAKIVFSFNRYLIMMPRSYSLLTAIYEDELIEEPQHREIIIENIQRQKEQLLVNNLGPR
jgi:hypothetical protein